MEVVQSLPKRGTNSKAEVRRDRMESLSGASMSKESVNAALTGTMAGSRDGGPLFRPRSHSPPPLPPRPMGVWLST